jgi:hypothetical protein
MINGEQVESQLLPMSMVIRGSCGGRILKKPNDIDLQA